MWGQSRNAPPSRDRRAARQSAGAGRDTEWERGCGSDGEAKSSHAGDDDADYGPSSNDEANRRRSRDGKGTAAAEEARGCSVTRGRGIGGRRDQNNV